MRKRFLLLHIVISVLIIAFNAQESEAYYTQKLYDVYNVRTQQYFNGELIYGYIPEEYCAFIAVENRNEDTIVSIYAFNDEIVSALYNGKNEWLRLYSGLPLSEKAPAPDRDPKYGRLLAQKFWEFRGTKYSMEVLSVPEDRTAVSIVIGHFNPKGKLIRGCVFDIQYDELVAIHDIIKSE